MEKSANQERVGAISVVASYNEVSVQGMRYKTEDTHIVIPSFRNKPEEFFAGIYDGHVGRRAADFIAGNLDTNLAHALEHSLPQKAIRQAFLSTDSQVKKAGITGGATVVIAYIKDRILYVANAGDSRAVLARGRDALRLSRDHKPNDPEEEERIMRLGGLVARRDVPRVNGILAVSRAIGDHDMGLDGFISAEPFITTTELRSGDNFLILACDGIWDELEDQQAVDIVRGITDRKTTKGLTGIIKTRGFKTINAAEKLEEEALRRGSQDNITAIVIQLNL